jgi:hypothetical protein
MESKLLELSRMVKLYNILQEALDEAKQVGILYHFTSYSGLLKIAQDGMKLKDFVAANIDKVKLGDYNQDTYVSFTRNRDLTSDTIYRQCRITVDGTKLSNQYKITPYADTKAGYSRTTQDESEERILVKKEHGYVDISKCVQTIDVLKIINIAYDDAEEAEPPSLANYYELLKYLKEHNIPFNLVTKYTR